MSRELTMIEYYKGRDTAYSKWFSAAIKTNAEHTVECANKLLKMMDADGMDTSTVGCNSGWRPTPVNNATPRSDPNSPHTDAKAIDLGDANGKVKKWISANPDKVLAAGFVATEDPKITSTWAHLQTRPPLAGQKGRVIWLAMENGWKNNFTKIVKKSLV